MNMAKQEAIKQVLFQWEGKSTTGQIKRGQQTAPSEAVIRAQLRRQGIVPTQVRKLSNRHLRGKRIKPGDIAIFTRQLATLMSAGVPLVQSFDIIGRGMPIQQCRHCCWASRPKSRPAHR